ncbi:unnamed protein product [Brassica oleracea]
MIRTRTYTQIPIFNNDLHNLISEILHGQLDDKHWSLKPTNEPVANKKKRTLVSEENDCMKKEIPAKSTTTMTMLTLFFTCGDDGFWHALMEAMKTLTAKVGSMDTVITEKMLTAVDTKTDAKVNARVGQTELVLGKQISTLEKKLLNLERRCKLLPPKMMHTL